MRRDGMTLSIEAGLQEALRELELLRKELVRRDPGGLDAERLVGGLADLTGVIADSVIAEQGAQIRYADDRVAELVEGLMAIARQGFPVAVAVSDRNDHFDALAVGLNMMAEEIEAALSDRALLESARIWFQEFFGSLQHAILVLAIEDGSVFRVLLVNEAAASDMGLQPDDMIGKDLGQFLSPGEAKITQESLEEALEKQKTVLYRREVEVQGRRETSIVSVTPVFNQQDDPSHLVAVVTETGPDQPERWPEALEELLGRVPANVKESGLFGTAREREVLKLIGEGVMSDKELAGRLSIAPTTARTHVRNILRKSGLHDRRDLLALALTIDT